MTDTAADSPGDALSASEPTPVPVTPADTCSTSAAALAMAADQLREHAVGQLHGMRLPAELARPGDRVGAGQLFAVADWLDARACLYGASPRARLAFDTGGQL